MWKSVENHLQITEIWEIVENMGNVEIKCVLWKTAENMGKLWIIWGNCINLWKMREIMENYGNYRNLRELQMPPPPHQDPWPYRQGVLSALKGYSKSQRYIANCWQEWQRTGETDVNSQEKRKCFSCPLMPTSPLWEGGGDAGFVSGMQ